MNTHSPVDAPAFFSEAFESHSFWSVEIEISEELEFIDGLGDVYLTAEAAIAHAATDPGIRVTKLVHYPDFDSMMADAKSLNIHTVFLRDAQGHEIKRWSVSA